MIIRDAKQNDAPQLIFLLEQMGYNMSLDGMQCRIAAFNSPAHKILVAEEESLLVGVVAFGCYEHFRLEGSCCHIDTLVIDKAYRGRGIGRQLMEAVEKFATKHGCKTIELITANRRKVDGTHAFYESLAYKDHNLLDYTYFGKELIYSDEQQLFVPKTPSQ